MFSGGLRPGTGFMLAVVLAFVPRLVMAVNTPVIAVDGVGYIEASRGGTDAGAGARLPLYPLAIKAAGLLVHDPDGTGLRDWGASAGLGPVERNRLAWCRWKGAVWPEAPPFDGKIEWGLCSSIH